MTTAPSGVVLRGGWVVDGTGAPPMRADVAVTGSRIAAVGHLHGTDSPGGPDHRQVVHGEDVDVTGRYILPGFVDTHVHADALAADPEVQLAALRQGVTTVILGQDGLSFAPASAPTIAATARYFAAVNGNCPPELAGGCTVADLLAHYDRATALNVAYLAPAGTIRAEVMGFSAAAAGPQQRHAMRALLEQALDDGAVGLSTGLEYAPGRFADATELASLCAPVTAAGATYVSHMRGYEAAAWQGLAEVRQIASTSGAAAHVSHLHGPANMITKLVDEARGDGIDLTFDSYPYLRGASILAMVALPPETSADGPDEALARLADPAERRRLARDWFPAIGDTLDRITLSFVDSAEWSWTEGLSLQQAAARAGLPMGELVCELVLASDFGAGCVFAQPPTNTGDDVAALLRHDAQMAGSDGIYLGGRPHPRAWGTFARLLGHHTRERGDWTWGQAALHLAGHPARRFGLAGRGLVRPGFVADLTVLDPATVTDRATYADPRRPATGVDHVLVSGTFALRDGAPTRLHPGRALRRGREDR